MSLAGFEPAIPANETPRTLALGRSAIKIGYLLNVGGVNGCRQTAAPLLSEPTAFQDGNAFENLQVILQIPPKLIQARNDISFEINRRTNFATFEVLTAVLFLKIQILWHVTLCR